jgi:uncharacterized membrane-anchored protein YjiN (DUF445 family)
MTGATMTEEERVRALRRMKVVATGLLGFAAIVFLVARGFEDRAAWIGYVRATAEAAMVGALADWFAVTALFRHPLGLPIPHTAIIPNRKDQIGRSLGEFVQGEFLTPAVITERLQGFQIGKRLGVWLTEPTNAEKVTVAAGDSIRAGLEVLDDDDVQEAIEQLVERRVKAMPVAPLVGRAIDIAVEGAHQQQVFDAALRSVRAFLDDNREVLREKLERESPWWVPEPIDSRIFKKIFNGVQSFLAEVGDDPLHEVRYAFDERVAAFAQRLQADPVLIAHGEQLKQEVLEHQEVRRWLGSLWGEIKAGLTEAGEDPSSELRARLKAGVIAFGDRLATDPELQAKVDRWAERAVLYVVENYRGEVANLIATTVERWDADATSRKLELQVGRDLQFIRINGTIVGGLAGLLIYTVSQQIF